MTRIDLDNTFAADYAATCVEVVHVPQADYYIPAKPRLIVNFVNGQKQEWVGIFGEDGPMFPDFLLTTPDCQTACVVAGGAGYFVEVSDPHAWVAVECAPIRYAIPRHEEKLLIFGDYVRIVAYESDPEAFELRLKIRWRTPRLGSDGLQIEAIVDGRIVGRVWNAANDELVQFSVDMETGMCVGGAIGVAPGMDDPSAT